jgi:membrane protein DedA with SNARE-associated domain
MEGFVFNEIATYGPIAVFLLLMLSGIGIPLGEDVIIIPAGVLIGSGELGLMETAIAAYLGVVLSDILWFLVCYHYGSPLLHKRWVKRFLHPRRLLEAKHQVERRGAWVIVMARFIPGSRTTVITISGILHLSPWQFALATASCVLVTVPLQLGLGYVVARGIGTEDTPHMVLTVLAVIAAIVAVPVIGADASPAGSRPPRQGPMAPPVPRPTASPPQGRRDAAPRGMKPPTASFRIP